MQETQEMWVPSLGQEDPLEKEMTTHSSILAWRIPWIEEPSRLQSMGLQSQTWLNDYTFTFFSDMATLVILICPHKYVRGFYFPTSLATSGIDNLFIANPIGDNVNSLWCFGFLQSWTFFMSFLAICGFSASCLLICLVQF